MFRKLFSRFRRRAPGPRSAPTTPNPQPQTQASTLNTPPKFGWGKALGYIFCVLLPAGAVVYANQRIFPDSSWIATIMVIITCGVAFIFTVASSKATNKTQKYVLLAHLLLLIVLSLNLAAHWLLAREVSAATQATTARHLEEDRAEERADRAVDRMTKLMDGYRGITQAQSGLANAERRRLQTAINAGLTVPPNSFRPISAPTVNVPPESLINGQSGSSAPSLTLEQVMEKWSPRLMYFAIADLLSSVVAFGFLCLFWEWDRNRNGIADHRERAPANP